MTEIAMQERQLANAQRTPSPRRRARFAAVSAALAAVTIGAFAALSVVGGPNGNGAAAFAIERRPDATIAVRIVNSEVSASEMTKQLRTTGLNVSVDSTPASAQLVGRWLSVYNDGVSATVAAGIERQFMSQQTTIVLPSSFTGELRFTVGRTPHPGEEINVSGLTNALAPTGSLYCMQLSGAESPASAAQKLTTSGYRVRWIDQGHRELPAPPVGTRIVAAFVDQTDPKAVDVEVLAPNHPLYTNDLWAGYPLEARDSGMRDYAAC